LQGSIEFAKLGTRKHRTERKRDRKYGQYVYLPNNRQALTVQFYIRRLVELHAGARGPGPEAWRTRGRAEQHECPTPWGSSQVEVWKDDEPLF